MNFGFPESDSEDELPAGWEERTTTDDRVYYVNHCEQSVQWTHPRTGRRKVVDQALPNNWRLLADEENRAIFENVQTGERTFCDPRLALAREVASRSLPRQRFDARSTVTDVLHGADLRGRTVFMTGGTSGIGLELVKGIIIHGAHVILGCRNMARGQFVSNNLRQLRHDAEVTLIECDLASLRTVKACAEKLASGNWNIDVYLYNAGVLEPRFALTEDGFERTFCVNYLGHFYLTTLLLDRMRKCGPARIVMTTCESHRFANYMAWPEDVLISWETLTPSSATAYSSLHAYTLSKLCCTLFAMSLQDRLVKFQVSSLCVHPGNLVHSNLYRSSLLLRLLTFVAQPFAKTLEQAASSLAFAAFSTDLDGAGAVYINNCWFASLHPMVESRFLRRRLWHLSELMIAR